MTLWYYEQEQMGRWQPVTSAEPPRLTKQHRRGPTGPRVRGLREVPASLIGASLNVLQNEIGVMIEGAPIPADLTIKESPQ